MRGRREREEKEKEKEKEEYLGFDMENDMKFWEWILNICGVIAASVKAQAMFSYLGSVARVTPQLIYTIHTHVCIYILYVSCMQHLYVYVEMKRNLGGWERKVWSN